MKTHNPQRIGDLPVVPGILHLSFNVLTLIFPTSLHEILYHKGLQTGVDESMLEHKTRGKPWITKHEIPCNRHWSGPF